MHPSSRDQFVTVKELTADNCVRQSWTALSASLSLSLPSGGSVSVVWGEMQQPLKRSLAD